MPSHTVPPEGPRLEQPCHQRLTYPEFHFAVVVQSPPSIVGSERVRGESTAATQIVAMRGGLTLALRNAAARLVTRRH